jgi:hypothetical protein
MDQAVPTAWNAGAIARFGWDALGSKEHKYEISHTLLHQHLLAMDYSILGETTIAARLLGVVCFIAVLFLIIQLSKQLFSGKKGIVIGGLAAILYALNPFAIQYSLLVDQETTILPLLLLIFFYWFFRQNFNFTPIAIAKLSAIFALCIWAKEFTPYFMMIALFPFLWLSCGFRFAFSVTAKICVFGTALFAGTWILYSLLTGVPVLSFVEFSVINKALDPSFHQNRSVIDLVRALARTGRWITPALLILLTLAAAYRITQLLKYKPFLVRPTDYLWLYVAVFWTITNLHMYQLARYQYPLYSVAVILIAEYLYLLLKDTSQRQLAISVLIGLIGATALALLLGDPHFMPIRQYFLFVLIVPFLICFLLLSLTRLPMLSHQRFILTILSVFLATNISLSIKQSDSYTTAVSWGEYGEKGFADTLTYLKANLNDSVPIFRKDFGYYFTKDQPNRDFEYIYNSIFRGSLDTSIKRDQVMETILRDDVHYIVLDQYTNIAVARELIAPHFDLIQRFGHFEIYKKSE